MLGVDFSRLTTLSAPPFFAPLFIADPIIAMHGIGKNIKHYGSDHVIWGTDCLWWGSPQWIIQAMHRFQMPEAMQKRWGYSAITAADKEKIFGVNAAKLFKVDIKAQRKAIPDDYMSRYKTAYLDRGILPENVFHGWVEG